MRLEGKGAEEGLASAERAARALREAILSGRLPPGAALREAALAAEIAVSRNTFREALRQLAAEGLVVQQLYKGATVRTVSAEDVRDIYIVRRALEQRAVEESALAPEEKFTALDQAAALVEKETGRADWRAAGTASLRFHQALVDLLGSRKINGFFHGVLAQLRLAFAAAPDEAGFQAPWAERDREIYDLLRAGRRTEASLRLSAYLAESERAVLDAVRGAARRSG
ncbi:GntR family transcriptional regulator [Azospirillum sp. SYSU D00513]|uniref:GntR family transcriptional regulator n=1 Tax=Azospirillum sp. SYSU D00513 TaxID=2812561 RepID=UPI001A97963F|nr:GntR family transcriptional regulator [Azospirillum sp. SYSU D00513]